MRALLARTATIVIATVRDDATAATLKDNLSTAPTGAQSGFFVFVLDLSALPAPTEIRQRFLTDTHDAVKRIDVLISNAGQATFMGPSLQTSAETLRAHFETNSIAPLIVFQAFWPLMTRPCTELNAAPPKLFMMSSSLGSIESQEPLSTGAYGPSKAALNWITKRLHLELEKEGLVSVALHPG